MPAPGAAVVASGEGGHHAVGLVDGEDVHLYPNPLHALAVVALSGVLRIGTPEHFIVTCLSEL